MARRTRHAQRSCLSLSSLHAKARKIANVVARIPAWMATFRANAEQLPESMRWPCLLKWIFRHFNLRSPDALVVGGPRLAPGNCRI
jgi:hypothetical protein